MSATATASFLYGIGTSVYQDGHGIGTIIAYNDDNNPDHYRYGTAEKYPYIVQFASGYTDGYSAKHFEVRRST